MRYRAMGILSVLFGVFFVAGGLDPLLRPASAGRDELYRRGDPAHPSATQMDGIRLPGRDGPAADQYAAFRGALPFPQFLAFIAIGIAALAHRAPTALPPQATVGIPGPDRPSAHHYTGGTDDQPSQL